MTREEMFVATTMGYRRRRRAARKTEARAQRRRVRREARGAALEAVAERLPRAGKVEAGLAVAAVVAWVYAAAMWAIS